MLTRLLIFLVALYLGAASLKDYQTQLLNADRAFDRATAENGSAAWASFFAEDGRMIRGDGQIVAGRPAIRQLMAPLLDNRDNSLRWEPDFAESSKSGDLGYTTGKSKLHTKDGDREGRYVTIWRRDKSGQWKVALDIGVSNPVKK